MILALSDISNFHFISFTYGKNWTKTRRLVKMLPVDLKKCNIIPITHITTTKGVFSVENIYGYSTVFAVIFSSNKYGKYFDQISPITERYLLTVPARTLTESKLVTKDPFGRLSIPSLFKDTNLKHGVNHEMSLTRSMS